MDNTQSEGVPRHVAVIMDGNGRWAQKRLLPRSAGHRAGMNNMIALSEKLFESGVKYCTFYTLSAENLSRPQEELEGLYSLFRTYFQKNVRRLKEKDIELRVIGDLTLLPEEIASLIRAGAAQTVGGKYGVLALAVGYGGRQEILRAANNAVRAGKELSESDFSALLDTAGMPDPDLLIRTGRELRLSNFLLWQCAYTEFYFTDTLFPDFSGKELEDALRAYRSRTRRFGRV